MKWWCGSLGSRTCCYKNDFIKLQLAEALHV